MNFLAAIYAALIAISMAPKLCGFENRINGPDADVFFAKSMNGERAFINFNSGTWYTRYSLDRDGAVSLLNL